MRFGGTVNSNKGVDRIYVRAHKGGQTKGKSGEEGENGATFSRCTFVRLGILSLSTPDFEFRISLLRTYYAPRAHTHPFSHT